MADRWSPGIGRMAMRTASGSTSPIEGSSCWARRTRSRASGIDGLSVVSKLNLTSVGFQCSIRRPAPSGRASITVVRTTRLKLAATGGVNTRNPTVGASGKCRPASRVALVGPATGTVYYDVGLVFRAVGDADAAHTIAGHDQIHDPGAANDFRAVATPRGGQHGMRVDHRIEPTLFGQKRHRRIADRRRINVRLQFLRLAQRDPLSGITPGPQLFDVFTLRRAIGVGFPFQTAAAVPPWRGAKLVGQRGMRLHAGDIQIVIGFRRLFVRVGRGDANAGGAAADARGLQHRNSCAGLSQPIRDRSAHHAGADHDSPNHLRLLLYPSVKAKPPISVADAVSVAGLATTSGGRVAFPAPLPQSPSRLTPTGVMFKEATSSTAPTI